MIEPEGQRRSGELRVADADAVISRDRSSDDPDARRRLVAALLKKISALSELGRHEDAAGCCDEALALVGEDPGPEWEEWLGDALSEKGWALIRLERYEAALRVFDELRERFAGAHDLRLRRFDVIALSGIATVRRSRGDYDGVAQAADELIARFGAEPPPDSLRFLVSAVLERARAMEASGNAEEAIRAYEALVDRYGAEADPYVQQSVAFALNYEGDVLEDEGRLAEALEVHERMLARADEPPAPLLVRAVFYALAGKSRVLRGMGLYDQALVISDEVIERGRGSLDGEVKVRVAQVLLGKATSLSNLGRYMEAIAACDEVLARFAEAPDWHLRETVERALVNKAEILLTTGDAAQALVVSDAVIMEFGDVDRSGLLAPAYVAKGRALFAEDRLEEALEAFDAVLARFADATDPYVRKHVTVALSNKTATLVQLGRLEEAAATQEEMVHNFSEEMLAACDEQIAVMIGSSHPQARYTIAGSLYNKATVLIPLERHDEALAVIEQIIDRFQNDDDEAVQQIVAAARGAQEMLRDDGAE